MIRFWGYVFVFAISNEARKQYKFLLCKDMYTNSKI